MLQIYALSSANILCLNFDCVKNDKYQVWKSGTLLHRDVELYSKHVLKIIVQIALPYVPSSEQHVLFGYSNESCVDILQRDENSKKPL